MTEDLGTPTRPHALTGEQWRLEVRTDDPPSPSPDERWIRSDLDSGDRIATLKCGDGTEIPLFPTGTAEETVREARRYRVGGQTVYAPLAPVNEAAFPARRVQHDGQIHAFHDRVAPGSAIPDSEVSHWPKNDDGTPDTLTDATGDNDGSISGATYVSDATHGTVLDFGGAGSGDVVTIPDSADLRGFDSVTFAVFVNPDDVSSNNKGALWGDENELALQVCGNDGSGAPSLWLGGTRYDCPNTIVAQDAWQWIGASWFGDENEVRWFKNGSRDSTTATSSHNDVGTTNDKQIGQGAFGDWAFDGQGAHLRIFSDGVSDDGMATIYDQDSA